MRGVVSSKAPSHTVAVSHNQQPSFRQHRRADPLSLVLTVGPVLPGKARQGAKQGGAWLPAGRAERKAW
jgi:hypothetical protein